MFVEDPERVKELTSLDPKLLAPINVFTYQLIAAPGKAGALVSEMAIRKWTEDLCSSGQVSTEAQAAERIEALEQNNPKGYEAGAFQPASGDQAGAPAAGGAGGRPFSSPPCPAAHGGSVAHGVRTIVLDECHHLLDYWAIVLRHLVAQIGQPRVIGLTATLPSPEDGHEYEKYMTLLADVDFEVPTPAVVKEGDLAPYRDLVAFVTPSTRELA